MPLTRCRRNMLIILAGVLLPGQAHPQSVAVTLTGWFSCGKCTAGRVAKGDIRPSNPVCSKECIEKGDEVVFLSEQGKESLKVKKYSSATDHLGYHLEVTGILDPATGTIAVDSVKRLSSNGASCARPLGATKK